MNIENTYYELAKSVFEAMNTARFSDFENNITVDCPSVEELNKIIAMINDAINALDNFLKILSILSAEGFHVLRIEDEFSKVKTAPCIADMFLKISR